jgi:hypothetical protein
MKFNTQTKYPEQSVITRIILLTPPFKAESRIRKEPGFGPAFVWETKKIIIHGN